VRELLGGLTEVLLRLVDVAQGDDLDVGAGGDGLQVVPALAGDADGGEAELLAGAEHARVAGGGQGGGAEEGAGGGEGVAPSWGGGGGRVWFSSGSKSRGPSSR